MSIKETKMATVYEELNKAIGKSVVLNTFDNKYKTKGDVIFHRNMRVLVLCGQFLGLNPVLGILGDDTSKLRFFFFSYKVLYSICIFIFQMTYFMLYWRKTFKESMNIFTLSALSFYGATSALTCMFLRIAMKWPSLVQDVAASKLEEYMDPRMMRKCYISTVVLLSMTMVDYSLGLFSRITTELDSQPSDSKEDIFRLLIQKHQKIIFDLGIQYNTVFGILFQVCDFVTTLCWNFPDVFIICMSIYLSSILEMINKKIVAAKKTQTSLEFWKSMREDYSRATQLVRKFDSVISGVIFIAFADNLIFICMQLFNILSSFHGYKQINVHFSFCYILVRALLMPHVAAKVHTASIMVAPTLYQLPSSVYCDEVQRFIDQVHNEKVALSGLQFFYVTKGLILSVGATIITYELVLLQFNND